jgi:hypothetical protein
MSLQLTTKSIKMSYAFNIINSNTGIRSYSKKTMNIEKLLNENLESFYPWNDSDNPPLDTNKNFLAKQKEIDEIFEGWRASM